MAAIVENSTTVPAAGGGVPAGEEPAFQVPWWLEGKMAESDLHARLAQLQVAYPSVASGILWRFLLARKGNVEKATTMFQEHLEWRTQMLPVTPQSCMGELQKKKLYFNGEDVDGNPVLYFCSSKQDPQSRNLDESMRMVIYTLEEKFQSMSHTDQITVFIDREGASKRNFDLELLKVIASSLSNNYPERMARTVVYPTGFVFRGIWAVVKMFLDPVTARKVHLCGSLDDVQRQINISNLPHRMGGDLPDEPASFPWEAQEEAPAEAPAEAPVEGAGTVAEAAAADIN